MRTLPLFAIAIAAVPGPALSQEGAPDYAMVTAYLAYPQDGAVAVPPNTLVFAVEVTALQLEGPSGVPGAALLDPSVPSLTGNVFEPIEDLAPGDYRVLGVPSANADNYTGPGVAIQLGTFTVGGGADVDGLWIGSFGATWTTGPDNEISIIASFSALTPAEPFRLEVDHEDLDTPPDGEPDATSPWMTSTSFSALLGDSVPDIDPVTALARLRAVDAAGNVGEWSDTADIHIYGSDYEARGCSAIPGSAGGGAGFIVMAITLGAALAWRRTR